MTRPNLPTRYQDNAETIEAWKAYSQRRLAPVTLSRYEYQIRLFAGWLAGLHMAELTHPDMWQYIDDVVKGPRGCRFFKNGDYRSPGAFCRKGQDMAQCGQACPVFEPVRIVTIRAHLNALASIYTFLLRRGHVKTNVAKDVLEEWWEDHRHLDEERPKRRFTTAELQTLIRGAIHPNRQAILALLPITGVRAEEALRLRCDADHFNFEEGWLRLPKRPHQKRRGEDKLWITPELRKILQRYLRWRELHVARSSTGQPKTDALFINANGGAMNNYDSLRNHIFNVELKRAGLLTGDEVEEQRLTIHDLRHYFTTEMRRKGVDDYLISLFRGDKRGVIADRYTHLADSDKRRMFLKAAPRIGL